MTNYASFDYDDMADPNSFLDNADVRVLESNTCMYDYNGKSASVPALHWKLECLEDGEIYNQYWKAGEASDWTPTDDGKRFASIGDNKKISKTTNSGMLIKSLKEAGFDMALLRDGDLSAFNGMECHVETVSGYRKGLESTKDSKVLVVSKIHKMPGEESTPKGKSSRAKSKAKPKQEPATQGGDDVESIAMGLVMDYISEVGGEVAKAAIIKYVQKALKGQKIVGEVSRLIFKDEFLSNGPWTYKNGKVSME